MTVCGFGDRGIVRVPPEVPMPESGLESVSSWMSPSGSSSFLSTSTETDPEAACTSARDTSSSRAMGARSGAVGVTTTEHTPSARPPAPSSMA